MIPIALVSGMLGAGKSTWLAGERGTSGPTTWVVVNDVADDMPDEDLLDHPRVSRIAGGCVCCDAADELAVLLRGLCDGVHAGASLERIVIETSGLSDPNNVAELIRTDPLLSVNLVLDEVVVVVDGLLGARGLRHDPLATRLVATADRIVVSKTDLCAADAAMALTATVRAIAPVARVEISPNPHGLAPERITSAEELPALPDGASGRPATPVTIHLDPDVDWVVLANWLAALLHAHGGSVLRMKGAVPTPNGPLVLNAVQGVMHAPRSRGTSITYPALTFVVRDLDPQDLVDGWHRFREAGTPTATRPHQEVLP